MSYSLFAVNEIAKVKDLELKDKFNEVIDFARPIFDAFEKEGHSGGSAGVVIPAIEHILAGNKINITEDTLQEVKEADLAYNAVREDLRDALKILTVAVLNHQGLTPITYEDNWMQVHEDMEQNQIVGHLFKTENGMVYTIDGFYYSEKFKTLDGELVDTACSGFGSLRYLNLEKPMYAWELPKPIYVKRSAKNDKVKNKYFEELLKYSEEIKNLRPDQVNWIYYEGIINNLVLEEKEIEFVEEDIIIEEPRNNLIYKDNDIEISESEVTESDIRSER